MSSPFRDSIKLSLSTKPPFSSVFLLASQILLPWPLPFSFVHTLRAPLLPPTSCTFGLPARQGLVPTTRPFLSLWTPGPPCLALPSPPPSPFTSVLCPCVSSPLSSLPVLSLLSPFLVSAPSPLSLFSFLWLLIQWEQSQAPSLISHADQEPACQPDACPWMELSEEASEENHLESPQASRLAGKVQKALLLCPTDLVKVKAKDLLVILKLQL